MRSSSLVLLALLAVGCAGSTDAPSRGDVVTRLPNGVEAFALAADGDRLVTALRYTDAPPATAMRLAHVDGPKLVPAPLPPDVSWHDVAAAVDIKEPWSIVRSGGGKAYFLGFYGVTVLALDGSSVRYLFRPSWQRDPIGDDAAAGYDADGDAAGGFAVADGAVYVTYRDDDSECTLGRFRDDGAYEALAKVPGEPDVTADAVVAGDGAVYFAAGADVMRWIERDRTVSTFWHASVGTPWRMARGGATVYVETLAESGSEIVALPESGAPAVRLQAFGGSDPASLGLAADDAHVYRLTQIDLRRYAAGGGAVETLAQRPPPPAGSFVGLAVVGSNVFFGDGDNGGDFVVRAVGR